MVVRDFLPGGREREKREGGGESELLEMRMRGRKVKVKSKEFEKTVGQDTNLWISSRNSNEN